MVYNMKYQKHNLEITQLQAVTHLTINPVILSLAYSCLT
jgi:hypothetical protein